MREREELINDLKQFKRSRHANVRKGAALLLRWVADDVVLTPMLELEVGRLKEFAQQQEMR